MSSLNTMVAAAVLGASFVASIRAEGPSSIEGFSISARVVEAIEDGPVAVLVDARYSGTGPVRLIQKYPRPSIAFDAPNAWMPRTVVVSSVGGLEPTSNEWNIANSYSFRRVYYLHHQFRRIPAGRSSIRISWYVVLSSNGNERKIKPEVTVEFDVHRKDARSLNRLVKRCEERLSPSSRRSFEADFDEKEIVENLIQGTRHAELVQLALRLAGDFPELAGYVYEAKPIDEADADVVQYLVGTVPRRADDFFDRWRGREHKLPSELVGKLQGAASPWIRMLTLATFPSECDTQYKKRVLREIRELDNPKRDLVDQLADPRYRVREAAHQELRCRREFAEGYLLDRIRRGVPAEAANRIKQLLKPIDITNELDWRAMVACLERTATPEADEILKALSEGHALGHLAAAASVAIKRRRSGDE